MRLPTLKQDAVLPFLLWVILILLSTASLAKNTANFPLPDTLQADVRFWSRVYTEVTTNEGLIHDNEKLNIIYARLSFSPSSSYKERRKIIKKKKESYKKTLLDLAAKPLIRLTERQHKRVKALWPKDTTREEFRAAAKRIRFQLGQADRFKRGLVRSGRWLPFIRNEFKELGIPVELAALPHVESSFRSDAKSHAGAAGLWQFTRSTGRRFMRIDHVVDERLDPFLATRAAGLLLKGNHQITGTWPLALTAYNHGAAGMRRAIKNTGGTDIGKIVREYKGRTFGFASRNFYNAFLAAKEIDEQPAKYFGVLTRDKAMKIQEVELSSYYTAKGLMTAFGLKNNIFKSLNPALQPTIWSNSKYVPKGYRLRVPVDVSASSTNHLIANIPVDERGAKQKADVSYRVRKGDSLSKIAQRFKVSSRQLVAINSLRNQHRIRIGQVLKLPHSAIKQVKGSHNIQQDAVFYQVKKGDRLSVIARKARVLEADLLSLNKLKNRHHLYIGQRLRLRKSPALLSVKANEKAFGRPLKEGVKTGKLKIKALIADPSNYLVINKRLVEVQSNETLGHFTQWLRVSSANLRQLNKLSNGARLLVGQRVKLDFSIVSIAKFEAKRLAFHQQIQTRFFNRYRVLKAVQRVVRKGDSVWLLAQQKNVPMWLLRQYNPSVDFNHLGVRTRLMFPVLEKKRR